jgi:hypothetical protein
VKTNGKTNEQVTQTINPSLYHEDGDREPMPEKEVVQILNASPAISPEKQKRRERLMFLEREIRQKRKVSREEIEHLREIRDNRLFEEPVGGEHPHPGYSSFRAYLAAVWGHTPGWASQNIGHIICTEVLEKQLPGVPICMSPDAALRLDDLIEWPNMMAEAYVEAYRNQKPQPGVEVQKIYIVQAVKPRLRYLKEYVSKNPDPLLSYEEYEADSRMEDTGHDAVAGLVAKAKALESDLPLRSKIVKVCNDHRQLPRTKELVAELRDTDLIWCCNRLTSQKVAWEAAEQAEEHRSQTLKDAERVDDDDLEGEESAAEEAPVGEEDPPVKKHLDMVFDELEAALDEKEWPLDTDDLQILGRLVKLIEDQLRKVNTKVSELLSEKPKKLK